MQQRLPKLPYPDDCHEGEGTSTGRKKTQSEAQKRAKKRIANMLYRRTHAEQIAAYKKEYDRKYRETHREQLHEREVRRWQLKKEQRAKMAGER